jgi:hypothetical protein
MSTFLISVPRTSEVKKIAYDQISALYLQKFMASFILLNLGEFPGGTIVLKNKVNRDYRRPKASERITGSFSSLGRWPSRNAPALLPGKDVIPFGNVSLKNPICLVNMIWNGKLTFSITAHSSICEGENELKLFQDLFVQRVLNFGEKE